MAIALFSHSPAMFIFMAVDAEVLPVRPVRRVVVAVTVFVMDGQELPVLLIELPAAFGADHAMDL